MKYILKGNGISLVEAIAKCEKNENKRMKSLVTGREYRINNDDIETLSASGLVWLGTSLCYEEIKGGWVVYEF